MTIKKFLPVALMIAVVAALYVVVVQYLKISALWVPFISWPLYFIAGAKPSRLHKEIIALTGGIIFGYLTLVIVVPFTKLFGGTLGLPLTVFIVAFSIVMLELTDWFELAPAYFFSYAGYFAYVFGGFGGQGATYTSAMFPYWVLLMAGLALGYLTAVFRKKILEKEGVFGKDQETVFDKEQAAR
ncbi:MAG: DUF1097 domain-containing protein [bacterium]|nr:DUF1097 domain-containing protein [bacterium]